MAESEDSLSLLFVRVSELAIARGAVPADGSGYDGVWTDEFPDADHDDEWFVATNCDAESTEYRVTDDRATSIEPFTTHVWWDTGSLAPAAICNPNGGQFHLTNKFERDVEDQIIASIELLLDELDYDDFEAVVADV
ncbi:hypothetical protein [Haloarcula sebkhae]|uniref:Uncharacterized protein n=2 Tax=Haloarcula sebkhae TaxID=932660 RepID=A0ACC6VJI1_9EURY|nr:hypothetical protein [Haloarcula sebkhae]GGK74286.1 hypothetical protein GCM10009067_28100 [Haloarcula sebkhae]